MKYFIGLLFSATILFGGDYVIIVNNSMKDLTNSEIRAIFLKKIIYIGDTKIVPINLEAGDPIRINFQEHFLHMNFRQLKTYWMKQHYLGHRPPISMKSQESIKTFVHKVNGAIGYIDAKNVDSSVRVVYRWSDGYKL
ncbi:hypothetical protein [Sulfurimonas sp.]|uniref:hypothetical protein n=1 Tax=Sulfurimonas sp. TaxID=2022749 RepID=UPI003D0A1320